jgi:hypothetical protein
LHSIISPQRVPVCKNQQANGFYLTQLYLFNIIWKKKFPALIAVPKSPAGSAGAVDAFRRGARLRHRRAVKRLSGKHTDRQMNSEPSRRPHRRATVLAGLVTIGLLACLGLVGYLMLPNLATRYLPVQRVRELGFTDFHGRITRIGPYQAAAGPFRLGDADRPAIFVQSVEMDYTPGSLAQKQIRRLRLADLTIHARLGPDGIDLPGLEWGKPDNRGETTEPLVSGPGGRIGTIEIRSARVILAWRQETYRIPFDADILPQDGDPTQFAVRMDLFPGDQRLSLTSRVDLDAGRADVAVEGAAIHLDRFADLVHQFPRLDLTGTLDLRATAGFRMKPFAVSTAEFNAAWHRGKLSLGTLSLQPEVADTGAFVSAVSADGVAWQVDVGNVRLEEPLPVVLDSIRATVDLGGDVPVIQGRTDVTLQPFSRRCPLPVALETGLPLALVVGIRGNPAGPWTATCQTPANVSSSLPPAVLVVERGRLTCGAPRIRLDLNGDGRTVDGRWQLDFGPIRASASGMQASLPSMRGAGTLRIGKVGGEAAWSGDARVEVSGTTVSGNGLTGKVDLLSLATRFDRRGGQAPGMSGRLQLSGGRLHHGPSDILLSGIRLDLPHASDRVPANDPGRLSIDRIQYDQIALGGLDGRISREPDALVLDADHASAVFPNLVAAVRGRLHTSGSTMPAASLRVDLPAYTLPAGYNLGRLLPDLNGATVSGTLSASGLAAVSASGLSGRVDVDLKGGRLDMAGERITVEGVDTSLHFTELPRVRSAPAQSLTFERAAMGRIVVDGGRIDFQVESPDTVLVEKGRLHWCGGKVDAQSLRLTRGKQAYALSLYCQRLGLSRILAQLGAVNASGSGTVNGRIPVTYDNGTIRFDDGFLFSTPGEPGKIRLTGTDILTRGIPAGTPQFAQVDVAREALKDYDYDWVKLGMNTEDETLALRLQFDGKPARALPFVFQRGIGSFVRVKAGEQGSIFQGIALDVNLSLPLDRLLKYKDVVDMIE